MILFFILVSVISAIIILLYLLAPQTLPWYRPHLRLTSSEIESIAVQTVSKRPIIMEGLAEPDKNFDISLQEKVTRLENILAEKNVTLEKLQKQLVAEKSHRVEFEKVQTLLNEEIVRLRTQNQGT